MTPIYLTELSESYCTCNGGIVQSFCVNKGKFAKVCGLADVKTLVAAIDYLEGEGLHCPYTDASDPLYCLTLVDKLRESIA
jgi:hypothetical protein